MTMIFHKGYHNHAVSPSKVPAVKHWAIVTFETVYEHTGYERLEDQGSPRQCSRYYVFTDQSEWTEALVALTKRNMSGNGHSPVPFVGLVVAGVCSTEVNVVVNVKENS